MVFRSAYFRKFTKNVKKIDATPNEEVHNLHFHHIGVKGIHNGLVLTETLYMINQSITQPINKACLFSKECLFKGVTVLVHACFLAMLILKKVLIIALVRYSTVSDH